jgi:hypothetical protein
MERIGIVVVVVLCLALPVVLTGQAPADLVQAVRARDAAIEKVDVATWQRFTASEFTVVNDAGRLLTLAERITELKQTKPAPSSTPCGQERITMFANGTAATRRYRCGTTWWLDLWVKSASGWQALAVQGTPAAK